MSMFIKTQIPLFKKGYPTVSDKYNVFGGILEGTSADVPFGTVVAYGSTTGYYKKATSLTAITQVAGIALATNVKLTGVWPDDGSTASSYKAKEAINLLTSGFIAVELDSSVVIVTVAAVKAVGAITADSTVVSTKTYYTRASSSAGAGHLNDGTYAYTVVAEPADANLNTYYELSVLGSNATTDAVTPGKQAALILATGGLTTIDSVSEGTVVALPGWYFTGLKEGRLAEIEVRR